MSTDEVTKNIWRNSVSNYVCIVLRLLLGLFMFRMLYQELGKEEFGFWSLLWSLFGYGILLDFGFGFTAMKRVAELSAQQKWDELSRVLSTIFYLYVVIGVVICAAVWFGSDFLIDLFRVSTANKEPFKKMLILFFCGMGIGFPLGIFYEILIGVQRIHLVNLIFISSIFGNFLFLTLGIHLDWGMQWYMVIGLLTSIVPCIVSGFYAFHYLPKIRIHPKLFSWGMVRKTVEFSVFAYINTASVIFLGKTDQLVLSAALAVSAVAIYQAGAKVGEMFGAFAQQLPDTFSPAAAHVNAQGDKAYLQKLLINGTRFSVMIATPAYFICAFYMEGILKLITGDKVPPAETFWISQTLLLWGYISVVTQSVPRRIFMMCGHERRLMWLTVSEAALKLALSIGLILYFKNVICVALGSLIATTLFGCFYIWPWAAREVSLSGWALARVVLIPTWLACLPLLVFVVLGRFTPWLDFRSSTLLFVAECFVAAAVGAIGLWNRALTVQEREALILKLGKMFTRSTII